MFRYIHTETKYTQKKDTWAQGLKCGCKKNQTYTSKVTKPYLSIHGISDTDIEIYMYKNIIQRKKNTNEEN